MGEQAADDAAVHDRHHPAAGMGVHDGAQAALGALDEGRQRLGVGDHFPSLFGVHLLVHRVVGGSLDPQQATLPVAQVHLAQVGHDHGRQSECRGERRRGLGRALQRGHVDGVDALGLQALAHQHGLALPVLVQGRITVAVDQREGFVGAGRGRFAVTHEDDRGRRRRGLEAVLAEAFGRRGGHPISVAEGRVP